MARRAVLCAAAALAFLPAWAETGASNQTLSILSTAKTTKGFAGDKAVTEAQLKQILACGANAPSAMNKQAWYFSAVMGKSPLNELRAAAKSAMPKPGQSPQGSGPGAQAGGPGSPKGGPGGTPPEPPKEGQGPQSSSPAGAQGGPGQQGGPGSRDILDNASAAIVVSGDPSWTWTKVDCAIACEAMAVAAQSLGLGSHIVVGPAEALRGKDNAALRKKLGIPETMEPQIVLLVGYPANDTDAVSKASTRATGNFSIVK
jgi:Nitroreductase